MRSDRFEMFSTPIVRLIKDVQTLKAEKMARYGLKGTNAVCLCCVYESGDGLTATELSSLGEIDKAQVSRCMTELTAKGYVYRDDRDGKRYKQKYRLTAEGARVAADVFLCFKEIEDALHSEDPITTQRDNKSVRSRSVISFSVRRYIHFCELYLQKRTRYNLVSLGCDVPRYARRDMI